MKLQKVCNNERKQNKNLEKLKLLKRRLGVIERISIPFETVSNFSYFYPD